MKHLWLIATTLLVFGAHANADAFEEKDDMDIEAEEMAADAKGAELNSAYLNQKTEQQKLDTRLDVSHAEKVIHDSKTQQVYAETMIGKAEKEIATLKRQQLDAMARRQKALEDRKLAIAKYRKTAKELKYYRARVKRAQALAMKDERNVAAVNNRTAKLQSMMPAPAPRPAVQQKQVLKPRVSKASVAQTR